MSHPDHCYSHDLANNCTIIKWGESGYYRTNYPEGEYDDVIVDEANARAGITPAMRRAMEMCSINAQFNPDLNWDVHYAKCLESFEKKLGKGRV